MKKVLLILIVITNNYSCKKTADAESWFRIEIKNSQDINCGVPDIVFITGKEKAQNILNSNSEIYVALNLPKVYYSAGQQLNVKIKKPDPGIACLALGPSFPQVEITEIK